MRKKTIETICLSLLSGCPKLPFIGWNMRLNRYIKLKRGDKAGIARVFTDCERALSQGNSIISDEIKKMAPA